MTPPPAAAPATVRCASCGRANRVPAAVRGRPRCAACHDDLPWVVDATDDCFADVVDSSRLVLVDLWAPWCGPCRTLSPILERVAIDERARLKLVKVNVDDHPAISARYGVQGIPTLLVLRDGELVDQRVGALPEPSLRQWLGDHLGAV